MLPIGETILIAEELGIEHPNQPQTCEDIVTTTDFLLTVNNGNQVVDVASTVKAKMP